jgi:hypothetical protein
LAELGRLSQQFRARWARPTGPVKAACSSALGHPARGQCRPPSQLALGSLP